MPINRVTALVPLIPIDTHANVDAGLACMPVVLADLVHCSGTHASSCQLQVLDLTDVYCRLTRIHAVCILDGCLIVVSTHKLGPLNAFTKPLNRCQLMTVF